MINTTQLSKQFGDLKAVDKISLQIVDNSIFGLAGTNGAGKSTFLRMLAGVLKQDEGEIEIDGEAVWENEKIKGEIFFLPDNAYFPPNVTPQQMAGYYSIYYSKFNKKRFQELCDKLELDTKRKINTFSKYIQLKRSWKIFMILLISKCFILIYIVGNFLSIKKLEHFQKE